MTVQVYIPVTVSGYTVQNNTNVPLTAYALEGQFPPPANPNLIHPDEVTIQFNDFLVDQGQPQIGPHQALTLRFVNGQEPGRINCIGAIFADGSTYGNSETILRLIERRKRVLASLRDALAKVESAVKEHSSREQAIGEFKTFLDSYARKIPFDESFGYVMAPYRIVIERLTAKDIYPVGSSKSGRPIPLEDTWNDIIVILEQKIIVLSSSKPKLNGKTGDWWSHRSKSFRRNKQRTRRGLEWV